MTDLHCLLFVVTLPTLFAAAIWLATYTKAKTAEQLQQELKEQTAMRLIALDTALEEWLVMLGLPQLEKETQRKEVAIRLRTVLIEKLLIQRVPN
jgi:hypothetical protein